MRVDRRRLQPDDLLAQAEATLAQVKYDEAGNVVDGTTTRWRRWRFHRPRPGFARPGGERLSLRWRRRPRVPGVHDRGRAKQPLVAAAGERAEVDRRAAGRNAAIRRVKKR